MQPQLSHSIDSQLFPRSSERVGFWHHKNQKSLVDDFSQVIKGDEFEPLDRQDIKNIPDDNCDNIFNNASHVWNHACYISYRTNRPKYVDNVWNIAS
ncbi:MAG: hypothetical protein A2381_17120 [Bdellovibrionales bacterium RIFOXYB1_FULL_37_110]|nr:MAG: hypothetical protein A2181_08125 [Bdellovibrionales bacterium RIFOXYA1_FULL_38_20]OFZ50118.1 MAG: hypothetical protein A2417_18955 [Bdellovibrionales bacterium RIFOXYC1_FULL_37_79]OFZ60024.1 MAG: hypothetical protein A2381_17120 [Bdellovibrionales bacterium RIFOXYB1_FULL_37_110]OFZ64253.1 MAG: hypothetical protein A2577_12535 [Bdellovibrionales bacterium RIFOXYD1_FULL_36_51]